MDSPRHSPNANAPFLCGVTRSPRLIAGPVMTAAVRGHAPPTYAFRRRPRTHRPPRTGTASQLRQLLRLLDSRCPDSSCGARRAESTRPPTNGAVCSSTMSTSTIPAKRISGALRDCRAFVYSIGGGDRTSPRWKRWAVPSPRPPAGSVARCHHRVEPRIRRRRLRRGIRQTVASSAALAIKTSCPRAGVIASAGLRAQRLEVRATSALDGSFTARATSRSRSTPVRVSAEVRLSISKHRRHAGRCSRQVDGRSECGIFVDARSASIGLSVGPPQRVDHEVYL
jgi:hypothetical protein